MSKRLIDRRWEAIESDFHFLEQIEKDGFARVTSTDLNQAHINHPDLTFEARLMASFDTSTAQPKIFQDNGISIIPIRRGEYLLGYFSPFQRIKHEPESLKTVHVPQLVSFESFEPSVMCNEAMKLNYADANGILSNFIGEDLTATIAGRMSGGFWGFDIRSRNHYERIHLHNPQIEIDAGFEGDYSIVLTEAKNHLAEEFNLRQLYYPFRYWRDRTSKEVRTVFVAFNNADAFLYEYVFPDPMVFEATLVQALHFVVDSSRFTKNEIIELFNNAIVTCEPDITFPQADSALRVMDVIEKIASAESLGCEDDVVDSSFLKELYAFRERQGLYYGDAACYLGYADSIGRSTKQYFPNHKALDYVRLSPKDKQRDFCSSVFSMPVFHDAFKQYVINGILPDTSYIAELIEKFRPSEYSLSTKHRRAQTVRAWLKWIVSLFESDWQ